MNKLFSIHIIFSFVILFLSPNTYATENEIAILQCKSNAIANRDYFFGKKEWVDKNDKASKEFRTGTRSKPNDLVMRDKIFSNLNTSKPIIKSITPPTKHVEDERVVEFKGSVVERTTELISITWKNPFNNKIWFATINLRHKKAIVSYLYNGATSFGINVETLDCK